MTPDFFRQKSKRLQIGCWKQISGNKVLQVLFLLCAINLEKSPTFRVQNTLGHRRRLKKNARRLVPVGFLSLHKIILHKGQLCEMQATTKVHQKNQEIRDLKKYFYNMGFITNFIESGSSLFAWNLFELIT